MLKKIILFTSVVATIYGCDSGKNPETEFSDAIISAQALRFEQVEQTLSKDKVRYCCTFAYIHADEGKQQGFDIKNGHFLKVRLDLDMIAYITFEYSCGTLMHEKRCSKKELDKKLRIEKADSNFPYNLFGKYRNGWRFFTSKNTEIRVTDKFSGFSIYSVEMENNHATLLLGVADTRPARIEFFTKRGHHVLAADVEQQIY